MFYYWRACTCATVREMDDREWSWHASCFRNHQPAADELRAMRQTMEDVMAKVIEFYIPDSFTKKVKCIAPNERGKVIEFPSSKKKSA
jgi:hypothetical protein